MNKKILAASIILLTFIIAQAVALSIPCASAATTATNSLKILAGPTSVPADNQAYNILAVQLQDSRGNPLRATEDTEVRLSSSATNVGTVDSTVTIPKDSTAAYANFYATYSPGTATVTATATGYPTAQVTITTVAPTPSKLAVYAFPSILPADGRDYNALLVQLQDSSGAPATAPVGGIQVSLSSSNATILSVDSTVSIHEGGSYTLANVKTSSAGTATVTATASGYTTAQTTLNVQQAGTNPASAIKVYLAPPKIQADGSSYQQVAVELQDNKGKLAQATADTTVTLASSSTAVATVDATVTVIGGQSFALAKFTTTYKAGTTTITASATNYATGQATLTTVGSAPTKVAVYAIPAALPADAQPYDVLRVQLQDSSGKPARDPTKDTTVYLSTSMPDAGTVTDQLTIPSGQTQATATFTATCAAGASTITAQADGLTSGQGKVTTYLIDPFALNITVTADPSGVKPGNQTNITAYVTYVGGGATTKATVVFASNKGGNFTTVKEVGDGYYTTTFTAPRSSTLTVCTITANATKTGYNSTAGKTQVTVDLNLAKPKGTLTLRVLDSGSPVAAAAVVSQTLPTGVQTLAGNTNASGLVSFANVPDGAYTFKITKTGYQDTTQTVQFSSSQTGASSVTLPKEDTNAISIPIAAAIAIVAVVVVVGVFMFMRRRRAAKVDAEDPQEEKGGKSKKK